MIVQKRWHKTAILWTVGVVGAILVWTITLAAVMAFEQITR